MAKSVGLGLQSHRGRGVQITRKFLLLVEVRICVLSQGNISESLLINKQLFYIYVMRESSCHSVRAVC